MLSHTHIDSYNCTASSTGWTGGDLGPYFHSGLLPRPHSCEETTRRSPQCGNFPWRPPLSSHKPHRLSVWAVVWELSQPALSVAATVMGLTANVEKKRNQSREGGRKPGPHFSWSPCFDLAVTLEGRASQLPPMVLLPGVLKIAPRLERDHGGPHLF